MGTIDVRGNHDIHWSEGMLLQAHHFQRQSLHVNGLVFSACQMVQPYLWGISDIAVAEDLLEGFTFGLIRFEGYLPDGTKLQMPTNLRADPRGFQEQLNTHEGPLQVYLGVPVLREGEPNTVNPDSGTDLEDLRWRVDTIEFSDLNTGGAPRPIEVKKLNGRFIFEGENRDGYDCLPIASLIRSPHGGNLPIQVDRFIPPVVDVHAWPPLARIAESMLHLVDARDRSLRTELVEGRREFQTAEGVDWQTVFKLLIVGGAHRVLQQLVSMRRLHPFTLYLELARMAGELSIFEAAGSEPVQIPKYDHENLGTCFNETAATLRRLLEKILAAGFARADFRIEGDLLVADLSEEWFSPDTAVYLCAETDLDDSQTLARIKAAKLASRRDIPVLLEERGYGLEVTLVRRTPGGLPSGTRLRYFEFTRHGRYWESLQGEKVLAMAQAVDSDLKLCLYAVSHPVSTGR